MREIKYRQYLGDSNWHYWGYLGDGTFVHPLVSIEEKSRSQQYTGLKDRNGREIYEGDIIEYELQLIPIRKTEIYEVTWWQSGFGFKRPGEEDGCATYLQLSKVAVIGNIHENPELCPTS